MRLSLSYTPILQSSAFCICLQACSSLISPLITKGTVRCYDAYLTSSIFFLECWRTLYIKEAYIVVICSIKIEKHDLELPKLYSDLHMLLDTSLRIPDEYDVYTWT